ncbi:hypothetical protein [Cellulomonas sp. ES6]|uniref:hypothetical protein n=1 Tax=Cellulomonas sp. ES6 TaxID=3039384 RepID=UPI0024B6DE7D|nr:hypothetical protein [Cellulomonas sp. ES6]WHP18416.1 hypothetical protein P9841_04445 [Cellulomonas sp. ES6]
MPAASAPAVRPSRPRLVGAVVASVLAVALAACTGGPTPPGPSATPTPTAEPVSAQTRVPEERTTVLPKRSAAQTALAASRALFADAPAVVLAADDDPATIAPAASLAVAIGVPALVAGVDGLADEIERLGATDVVAVGGTPDDLDPSLQVHAVDPGDAPALAELGVAVEEPHEVGPARLAGAVAALDRPGTTLLVGPAPDPAAEPSGSPTAARSTRAPEATASPRASRGRTSSPEASRTRAPSGGSSTATTAPGAAPSDGVLLDGAGPRVLPPEAPRRAAVLVDLAEDRAGRTAAALATARAAGVPVVDVPGGDPRSTSETVGALDGVRTVVALAPGFGAAAVLGPRVAAAATGVELPGGGQLVFPRGEDGKRYVALYGTPGTPALGVLGEQDVPATIARARQTAEPYEALTDDTVVPTLEIIATIASSAPEPDGSYSRARSVQDLRPLVEAAQEAGQAVVIDLQPGRTDFVTQAKQYAELLAYPHVGLALDPEWRLAPDQVHLRQIGSVGVDEVNATAEWLAGFTREHHLPQKMFLLHQFSLRMITDRERLDTSHDELAVIIHADGQGSQPAKADTWRALRQGAPDVHWGWKNFYDEDQPMLDPAQTYAVQPTPDLVTYQ